MLEIGRDLENSFEVMWRKRNVKQAIADEIKSNKFVYFLSCKSRILKSYFMCIYLYWWRFYCLKNQSSNTLKICGPWRVNIIVQLSKQTNMAENFVLIFEPLIFWHSVYVYFCNWDILQGQYIKRTSRIFVGQKAVAP